MSFNGMIDVSDEAIQSAKSYSERLRGQLAADKAEYKSLVDKYLGSWSDPHVQKFVGFQSQLDDAIESMCGQISGVEQFCEKVQQWLAHYRSI